jgi:hypothetical protein
MSDKLDHPKFLLREPAQQGDVIFKEIDGVVHIIDLEKHGTVEAYLQRMTKPAFDLTEEEEADFYG